MGESNMFEGLGDELKESEDPEPSEAEADSPEAEPADSADTSEPATSDAASSTEEPSKEELSTEEPSTEKPSAEEPSPDEESQMSDNTLSHDQPAFPFVNNYVESIYPRPETWDEFKDVVDLDLERTFREHDVRNMSGREIHDAALRLAAENPDELARIALEARGIDYES